jgi:hypothetical protein
VIIQIPKAIEVVLAKYRLQFSESSNFPTGPDVPNHENRFSLRLKVNLSQKHGDFGVGASTLDDDLSRWPVLSS